ncbi:transposase family protein [Methylocystis hirsuta]|uniref:Transposase n=1 Tax=Methylocystis hirsuta TaxID=369798 RepID=A0A3M9XJC3_9HYPH|nr:transposase [Methylocystis hirsuta]
MAIGSGVCPDCGKRSTHRHGWHERQLQDLPAQGAPATVKLRLQRWQRFSSVPNRASVPLPQPDPLRTPWRPTWLLPCGEAHVSKHRAPSLDGQHFLCTRDRRGGTRRQASCRTLRARRL